jgi:PAS domain S-box-containing protein
MTAMREQAAAQRVELAAILASTHDAIIGTNRQGVINSWNSAAAELYGYPAAEIIGHTTAELAPPRLRQQEAAVLGRIVNGGPPEHYQTERVRKDGTLIAVSVTISAILDATNAVVGVVRVCGGLGAAPESQDRFADYLTDHHRAADVARNQLQVQNQQAQRLEVLGRLAGGVAHDFNNLLAVILNYATFVAEELTAAIESPPGRPPHLHAAQRDVGQIKRAAERASDLTHQLLAFARREAVQPRVLNLNEAVLAVEELLRRTLGEDMVLEAALPADLWPILADPGQVEQVLVNLAINARDAMPAGGILRIDTANVVVDADSVAGGSPARPGQHVRLRVSDSGTGMTPEVISHVFEPFFTTKAEAGGTGLGLATVYGIVTEAGGTIAITSEPGDGTTFTIMLPITEEDAAVIEEPQSYHRTPAGETVLVVEDQEALREVTERILTRNGYRVLTAANGPEALAIAARPDSGDIHLLLTDVVLPKMPGKEVAQRVCAIRPDVEVLFMSGYAQPVLASQGRLEPGVALVDKPFSEADLIAKAALVLDDHFRGFQTVADGR